MWRPRRRRRACCVAWRARTPCMPPITHTRCGGWAARRAGPPRRPRASVDGSRVQRHRCVRICLLNSNSNSRRTNRKYAHARVYICVRTHPYIYLGVWSVHADMHRESAARNRCATMIDVRVPEEASPTTPQPRCSANRHARVQCARKWMRSQVAAIEAHPVGAASLPLANKAILCRSVISIATLVPSPSQSVQRDHDRSRSETRRPWPLPPFLPTIASSSDCGEKTKRLRGPCDSTSPHAANLPAKGSKAEVGAAGDS